MKVANANLLPARHKTVFQPRRQVMPSKVPYWHNYTSHLQNNPPIFFFEDSY